MKEIHKVNQFQGSLVNNETGEVVTVQGTEVVSERYYSIRKLNRKVQYMDLIDAMAKIANSSMEIRLFGILFDNLDDNNTLTINISETSRKLDVSRPTITKILKRSVECGFTKKLATGKYMVNPYIVRGSKFKSNEKFESVQRDWDRLIENE